MDCGQSQTFCAQMEGGSLMVPGDWEELPASRVLGPTADDLCTKAPLQEFVGVRW